MPARMAAFSADGSARRDPAQQDRRGPGQGAQRGVIGGPLLERRVDEEIAGKGEQSDPRCQEAEQRADDQERDDRERAAEEQGLHGQKPAAGQGSSGRAGHQPIRVALQEVVEREDAEGQRADSHHGNDEPDGVNGIGPGEIEGRGRHDEDQGRDPRLGELDVRLYRVHWLWKDLKARETEPARTAEPRPRWITATTTTAATGRLSSGRRDRSR